MEKPTCETCPYWYQHTGYKEFDSGNCRRRAPTLEYDLMAHKDSKLKLPTYPTTDKEKWCGEHPDFPAWIAARPECTCGGCMCEPCK